MSGVVTSACTTVSLPLTDWLSVGSQTGGARTKGTCVQSPAVDHHVSLMGPDSSDAWHRMPRKILHPMPRKSEKSGFSDFRESRFSEIWKSGNLTIRIFGFPEVRIFGYRISEIPKTRKSGFSNVPIFWIFENR